MAGLTGGGICICPNFTRNRNPMTTERDIYASANLLITKHGVAALKVAQEQLEKFEAEQDVAGADVWWRILTAIEVLLQPPPKSPLN